MKNRLVDSRFMKVCVLFVSVFLCFNSYAQFRINFDGSEEFPTKNVIYVSVQGNWDYEKNKSRAQFGGDNRLLNPFFNSFRKEFMYANLLSHNTLSGGAGQGEVSFRITPFGDVDLISSKQSFHSSFDSVFFKIVRAMKGKWRAGTINDVKQSEIVTIWYSVYFGDKKKFLLDEYISLAEASLTSKDFKKTLKYVDEILEYDKLSFRGVVIKSLALVSLNKKDDACRLLNFYSKYHSEKIIVAKKELCN